MWKLYVLLEFTGTMPLTLSFDIETTLFIGISDGRKLKLYRYR